MSDSRPKSPDPRRGARHAVDLECEVIRQDFDEPVPCQIRDLSASGMWIETTHEMLPGEKIVVTFHPPDWPSPFAVTVFGEVARISMGRRRSDHGLTGMGIEFTDLGEAEREALSACLEGLPPPLPRRRSD